MLRNPAPGNKVRTSPLWQMFKRVSPGIARCCLCRRTLSFKSSNTNLKRHLLSKHFEAYDAILGQTVPKSNKDSTDHVINLISIVKLHPCLWDTRCDSYGSFHLQHEAWNKIAAALHPTEEQSTIITKLSEQFSVLRNGFLSNRQCRYSKELSFMLPLLDGDEQKIPVDTEICRSKLQNKIIVEKTTSNKDGLVTNQRQNYMQSCFTPVSRNEGLVTSREDEDRKVRQENSRKTSREINKLQMSLIKLEAIECNLQFNNADEDTLFLLSLVDEIRRVPKEFEMNFKAELLTEFSKQLKRYKNES